MASESETMRTEFEAWFSTTRHREDATDGALSYRTKSIQWEAWQAARSRAPSAEAKDADLLPDRLDRLADELVAADTHHDSFMPSLAQSIKGRAVLLRLVHGPTGKPSAIAQQGAAAAQEVGRG